MRGSRGAMDVVGAVGLVDGVCDGVSGDSGLGGDSVFWLCALRELGLILVGESSGVDVCVYCRGLRCRSIMLIIMFQCLSVVSGL